MNKKIKIVSLLLVAALGASTIGVSIYFIVKHLTTPQYVNNVYNDVAMNLSESHDSFDAKTLDYYKENTGTLFLGEDNSTGTVSGEMGTIWNYPSNSNEQYFATNIHVVSKAINGTAKDNNLSLNPDFIFWAKTAKMNKHVRLPRLSIVEISAYGNLDDISKPLYTDNTKILENSWYSDFIILSTSEQIFNETNSINFLNTLDEYNWLKNELKSPLDLEFYICGYPGGGGTWPVSAIWTTIKYVWNGNFYYSKSPNLSSAAMSLGSAYLDPNNESGQLLGNPDDTKGIWYKNYSQQLLLPKLNLGGGSSGSLLSVKYFNSLTNEEELLAIGIYWGGYSSGDAETNKEPFLGGIDLFYASDFIYSKNPSVKLNYSNIKLNN